MNWYNGYNPRERSAMDRAPYPPSARQPPCAMCGDPQPIQMQTHAEDYSTPYRWEPPSTYPVCRRCHSRLHSRFISPANWGSFLNFLRRGYYAREVSSVDLGRLARLGDGYTWPVLTHEPPVRPGKSAFWWESLTLDVASRESASFRAMREHGRSEA